MEILIGADFVATESNTRLFEDGNGLELFGAKLLDILKQADYRIFNLETPLTDRHSPIKKCGPNLGAPKNTVKGYLSAGVNLLTLANNHIMDQGADGLHDTCDTLKANGISFLGVGANCIEASKPVTFSIDGKTYGVYGCVEHEFSVAKTDTSGANPFDPLVSLDHIYELSKKCDRTIVLYHGGKELYRYPTPNLQLVCRRIVEKGADLVICQHSHCLGCYEKYHHGTIVYGQGNFLFDHSGNECWATGALIKLDGDFNISYIPIKKDGNRVRLAEGEEGKNIMTAFQKRSYEIQNDDFVRTQYIELINRELYRSFYSLGGRGRSLLFHFMDKILKRKPKVEKWYSREELLNIQNAIECETHRELIIEGIKTILQ